MRAVAEADAGDALAPRVCKSCASEFQGRFCPHCGEKVYREQDKSLLHFAEEAVHFATHLDGKFATTLRTLFTHPGRVARDYGEGRRRPYVKPLTLFMLTVLLCLLFPVFKGMNISFAEHLGGPSGAPLHRWAGHKASAEGIDETALAAKFDAVSPRVAKAALLSLLPFTALWLALLFARPSRMLFDHLLVATELNTVFLLLTFVALPAVSIALLATRLASSAGDDSPLTLAAAAIFAVLSGFALKRFYGLPPLSTALRTVLFLAGYAVIFFFLYRLITFALVMLFI